MPRCYAAGVRMTRHPQQGAVELSVVYRVLTSFVSICCNAAFPSGTVIVCRVGDDVYLRELILLEAIMETAAIFQASKRVSPDVFKGRALWLLLLKLARSH